MDIHRILTVSLVTVGFYLFTWENAVEALPVRLAALTHAVRAYRGELLASLITVETRATAEIELDWLITGLQPPDGVMAWLGRRRGVGTVHVALPATLPMYSFLLFALAPAIVGNHVVVRPASISRHCVELVAALAAEAGMPVEVAAPQWDDFAQDAAESAQGMVFCGSSEHALKLDQSLPEHIRLICQGPGVCALVVTPDADLSAAARAAMASRLFNSSQDCLSTERIYVAEEVFEVFLAAVRTAAQAVRVGRNDDPATELGPLLIPAAAAAWFAQLAVHGDVVHPGARHGEDLYGVAVVTAAADSPLVLQETYCPVLPIVCYRNESELQQMLRLGEFALGLTVFGTPPAFGTLDFGHVAINDTLYSYEDAWAPFGGNRATTLLRHNGMRRSGPVLVPFALSEPA